ncbi:MAG: alcohol dehydrogenase catalytic domain-containing protein [Chloroflexi bacterium]|nr:alcohol dehydrogenase catalytic domain-containing protein [Chloroflexota bacterium]
MKAWVFHGPRQMSLEDRPVPQVGPGDILIQVKATAICASDIRVYKGEKDARAGVILGHEVAGGVVDMGAEVEGFALGDDVTLYPILACGKCLFCQQGHRNRCSERTTLGYEHDGGLAEYLLIPEALVRQGHVMKVPAGLSLPVAALTEPLACCLNSLETCKVKLGQSLLIVGGGPMGLMHLLLAQALGCSLVIVSEPLEARRRIAREWGAITLDPRSQDIRKEVIGLTRGMGVGAVVVTVGEPGIVLESLEVVSKNGCVSLFAGFPPGSSVTLDPNLIHYNVLILTASQNATPDQFRRALSLAPNLPSLEKLITHCLPLGETLSAFEARMSQVGLKWVITP